MQIMHEETKVLFLYQKTKKKKKKKIKKKIKKNF